MTKRIAVIGAGYAGMAAAVALADTGHAVTVFETSRVLGGRSRKVESDLGLLDNGQHILIGAYRDTLALMHKVGVDERRAFLRLPLTLSYPGFRIRAPRLPAPLHLAVALITAQGLSWREKRAAISFMQWLKQRNFRLDRDCTVQDLLDAHAQPQALRRHLWDPLCIGALNTPAETASAQVFANVLRDSLAAERAASDLLIPRIDLSALLAEPAARYVEARGGEVRASTAVGRIVRSEGGYRLDVEPDTEYSHVVVAVAPRTPSWRWWAPGTSTSTTASTSASSGARPAPAGRSPSSSAPPPRAPSRRSPIRRSSPRRCRSSPSGSSPGRSSTRSAGRTVKG